ncbi:hypothetical protein ACLESO_47860 [Pyxidicoccus sp. 3LG]
MRKHLLLFASLSAALSLTPGTFQTVLWNGADAPHWAQAVAYGVAAGALPPRGSAGVLGLSLAWVLEAAWRGSAPLAARPANFEEARS